MKALCLIQLSLRGCQWKSALGWWFYHVDSTIHNDIIHIKWQNWLMNKWNSIIIVKFCANQLETNFLWQLPLDIAKYRPDLPWLIVVYTSLTNINCYTPKTNTKQYKNFFWPCIQLILSLLTCTQFAKLLFILFKTWLNLCFVFGQQQIAI